MCTICSNAVSLGDAGMRMVICKDTNEPTPVFISEKRIINEYAQQIVDVSNFAKPFVVKFLNQKAYEFLKFKQEEAKPNIYYDEDHFDIDLENYFKIQNTRYLDLWKKI